MRTWKWFKMTIDLGRIKNVRKNAYLKSDLDKLYYSQWNTASYGDGLEYFNRQHIKAKFKKSDLWIDEFIVPKCRVVKSVGNIISPAEYAEYKRKNNGKVHITGWVREDVYAVVESGVEVTPSRRTRYNKAKLNQTAAFNRRRKIANHKTVIEARDKHKVVPKGDPFELALEGALMKKELEREDRRREIKAKIRAENERRNEIRAVLDMSMSTKPPTLTNDKYLQYSDVPAKVFVLFARTNANKTAFTKAAPFATDCVYTGSDTTIIRQIHGKFHIFRTLSRIAKRIRAVPPKQTPSWIILSPTTNMITDHTFLDKLDQVPTEYAAVGAFGYEYMMPDGSWIGCRDTYGMYTEYDDNMTTKRHVIGTKGGIDSSNEVAVIDGPFIAVRGYILPIIEAMEKFSTFGDGMQLYPVIISYVLKSMNNRLLQIPVDCAMVKRTEFTPGTLEWNHVVDKIVTLRKYRPKPLQA